MASFRYNGVAKPKGSFYIESNTITEKIEQHSATIRPARSGAQPKAPKPSAHTPHSSAVFYIRTLGKNIKYIYKTRKTCYNKLAKQKRITIS